MAKAKSYPKNSAHSVNFYPKYEHLYERKPKATKPFGLRMLEIIQSTQLDLSQIKENNVLEFPPW